MKFNKIKKIILFGGAPILLETAKWLKEEGVPMKIYTAPRQAAEPIGDLGETLGECLQREGIFFTITDDINVEPSVRKEIDQNTLGLGFGEAWSFDDELIQAFEGRLLDLMGIPHPRYRGGAHYTWMILRGDREGACNLQVINNEMVQGVFDSGEIVKTKKYLFPKSARIPQDYFNTAVKKEIDFIKEFLSDIKKGKEFNLKRPDEKKSLFFPRLNTQSHGWVDWSWQGEDIDRFICAFDDPYKGASTRLKEKRVFLKGSSLDRQEKLFHPFQSGLITRIWNGIISVATTSGLLNIKLVRDENSQSISNQLSVGMRFITPRADIKSSMNTYIQYGAR